MLDMVVVSPSHVWVNDVRARLEKEGIPVANDDGDAFEICGADWPRVREILIAKAIGFGGWWATGWPAKGNPVYLH